jgi:hypothetical protein
MHVGSAHSAPVERAIATWARRHVRIEGLLTERPTLAIPRLGHNGYTDLFRKQQVLGSNPSVGSTPLLRAREEHLSGVSTAFVADEDLLTD